MKSAPDEILGRFAFHLSCEYSIDRGIRPCRCTGAATSSLSLLLSSLDEERVKCLFPCLALGPPSRRGGHRPTRWTGTRRPGMNTDEEGSRIHNDDESLAAAARDLRRTMRMGKRAVPLAPSMLLRNVLRSFGALLERRLRRTVFKLAERSAMAESKTASRDGHFVDMDAYYEALREKERIASALRVLSSSGQEGDVDASLSSSSLSTASSCSLLNPISAYTTFSAETNDPIDGYWEVEQDGSEVELPLRFMVCVDVHVLDERVVSVTFGAPGTIKGVFASRRNRPDSVAVDVDTNVLLREMKRRCRELVKMAVSIACEGTPGASAIVDDLDSVSSVSCSSYGSASPDRVGRSSYSRLSRKTRSSGSKSPTRNHSTYPHTPSKRRRHHRPSSFNATLPVLE